MADTADRHGSCTTSPLAEQDASGTSSAPPSGHHGTTSDDVQTLDPARFYRSGSRRNPPKYPDFQVRL